jgi:hypothetical protein
VPGRGMSEKPAPFFLIVADHDRRFFCVEGPMTDGRSWNNAARRARPGNSLNNHKKISFVI